MLPESVLRHIHGGPLSADVELALREAILGGYLKPGDRIIEGEIADQIHVSRGPVREALSKLEQDGLVSRKRHRGTFVKTLSHRDVSEIYSMLALLEGEAAARAVEYISEADLASMEALVEQFGETLASSDIQQMMKLDRSFHGTVIRASQHGILQQTCANLEGLMAACFLTINSTIPGRLSSMVERHRVLVDVLRSRNSEKARAEFARHYLESLQAMANVWESGNGETKNGATAG